MAKSTSYIALKFTSRIYELCCDFTYIIELNKLRMETPKKSKKEKRKISIRKLLQEKTSSRSKSSPVEERKRSTGSVSSENGDVQTQFDR